MSDTAQPRVLLFHPGTQHAFHLARQLDRHGMLWKFATGFAVADEGWMARGLRLAGQGARRRMANRVLPGIAQDRLLLHPVAEIRALRRLRRGEDSSTVFRERNEEFQRRLYPERHHADIAIGFNTSSWFFAAEKGQRGRRRFVLDQTATHTSERERIDTFIKKRHKDWWQASPAFSDGLRDVEDREIAGADAVVVASSYARRTLVNADVPPMKVTTIPYGVDLEHFRPAEGVDESRPRRFLYVGRVTAHKGAPLLLEAWDAVGGAARDWELWIVGQVPAAVRPLLRPSANLRIHGPASRDELARLLRQCDVAVFPSYNDGYGLVLLEAMASGLPLIASTNCGAPDLVGSPHHGTVFPAGNVESLAAAMREFVHRPDQLPGMRAACRARAEEFSWDAYGDAWARFLRTQFWSTRHAAD